MNAITKRLLALGASGIIAVTGGYLVAPWEGMETKAYQDIVGVWTICYGETAGVKAGMTRTQEQCEKSLVKELTHYNQAMKKPVKVKLPEHMEVAYTSFVWNVGVGAWNSSTLLKLLNQGQYDAACAQILRWNKAGGKEVKGLTNRRNAEYKTCTGKDNATNEALEQLRREAGESLDVSAEEAKRNEAIQSRDEIPTDKTSFGEFVDGSIVHRDDSVGDNRPAVKVVDYACRFSLGSWCLWKVAR